MNSIVSVVIADRHPVVLEALNDLLVMQQDFRVVARCSDAASCIEAIRSFSPKIAIISELSMPDISRLDIIAKVNSEDLPTQLVFFITEERESTELAGSGAYGVILKDAKSDMLVQTLRQIAASQRVLRLPVSEESAIARKPRWRRKISRC
jgi:two-component system nitrate/nitrite response regulator NarL